MTEPQSSEGEREVVDEQSVTPGPASIKPVLMVAGMLLSAILGAAVTTHLTRAPAQHKGPSVGIVVIRQPQAASHQPHLVRRTNAKPEWV
ncbi:MAG: hypothetical protein ABSD78_16705 [Acidimicrobiales bacterium]